MSRLLRTVFAPVVLAGSVILAAEPTRTTPKFYADDPLAQVIDTQDASKVQAREISLTYDALINLFGRPGLPQVGRAESINTIDEVPDSNWFVNRAGTRPITPDEMLRGPNDDPGPQPGTWTVSRKANGVSPGFTITDKSGHRYFLKFDPPGEPELGTGAEAVVTRLFHALGYYVPQASVGVLRREYLVVGEGATVLLRNGHRRAMRASDIDEQLRRAERNPDGSYRVIISSALEGTPLEGFMYEGTRPDDPNDVIPHEDRRELRGLRVFSAWVNHTDAKAINSMDMLVKENGRSVVRHHLLDFNATLGSAGIGLRERRDGYEYLAEFGPAFKALPSFGLYVRPWMTVDYPDYRGIGRFEAKRFVPEEWRPRVPNPAYVRSRPDDTFWAARKLMALSDDLIRAAVRAGKYSDPRAAEFLAGALIERRDAIGKSFLVHVNPVVDPSLSSDGRLSFGNAAVQYRLRARPIVLHGRVASVRQRDRRDRTDRRDERRGRRRVSSCGTSHRDGRVRPRGHRGRRRRRPLVGLARPCLLHAHGEWVEAGGLRSSAGCGPHAARPGRGGKGGFQITSPFVERPVPARGYQDAATPTACRLRRASSPSTRSATRSFRCSHPGDKRMRVSDRPRAARASRGIDA